MSETNYRIRYKKDSFEIEVQGDKAWVEKKFEELTSKEIGITGEKRGEAAGMPGSLGEFLGTKGNPKKHTDVTAVFAYWMLKVENIKSFNVKDMLDRYDLTRKTKPTNINVAMDTNVERHVFAVASEKKDGLKAWVITDTGEEYVRALKK